MTYHDQEKSLCISFLTDDDDATTLLYQGEHDISAPIFPATLTVQPMSFSDLRESRKTKSYVNKIPSVEAVANNEQITASLGVLPWDDLYPSLPTATEIRTSDVSGRGVWATHQLRPGSCYSLLFGLLQAFLIHDVQQAPCSYQWLRTRLYYRQTSLTAIARVALKLRPLG